MNILYLVLGGSSRVLLKYTYKGVFSVTGRSSSLWIQLHWEGLLCNWKIGNVLISVSHQVLTTNFSSRWYSTYGKWKATAKTGLYVCNLNNFFTINMFFQWLYSPRIHFGLCGSIIVIIWIFCSKDFWGPLVSQTLSSSDKHIEKMSMIPGSRGSSCHTS